MANDANWVQLQTDIKPHHATLREAANTVLDEEVSNYPIFVAYAGQDQESVPGIHLMDLPTPRALVWTINLSTLEELVAKQIVQQDRIDPFRKVYRENEKQFCFLIIDEAGGRFGFVPF